MHRIHSLFRMIAIIMRHGKSRPGDVALYKADVFLGRVRPDLAERLSALPTVVPEIDMPKLRQLPEQSFGRGYADFLDNHGLAPFVTTELSEPKVLARNLHWARYSVVHDMYHVLLGAGPDLVGEMRVYAFTLAQNFSLAFWMFIPLVFTVLPLLAPHRALEMLRAFREGYQLGRDQNYLMAERLEDEFSTPVAELRRRLGLAVALAPAGLTSTNAASGNDPADESKQVALP